MKRPRASGLAAAARAFRAGDLDGARAHCEAILASEPRQGHALHLLGLVHLRSGQVREAADRLADAAVARPGDPEVLGALASAADAAGREPVAVEAILALSRQGRAAPDQQIRAAELALALDRASEAEALLERALATLEAAACIGSDAGAGPDAEAGTGVASRVRNEDGPARPGDGVEPPRRDPERLRAVAWSLRAWVAEQCNRDEEADRFAAQALALAPGDFRARFVRARVLEKAGQVPVAAFEAALGCARAPADIALVRARLGQLAERAGRGGEALEHYRRGNEALRPRAAGLAGTSVYGLPAVAALGAFLTPERLRAWAGEAPGNASGEGVEPIFLVGFPRSGTTLLDRVLAVHPSLRILEERDTLGPLLRRYAAGPGALERLDAVDPAARREAAALYRRRLTEEGVRPGERVIDKLPLNSIHLALIHRLFPRARVLFALRDPRDVCISCYAQAFGLNEAMSHFLGWEETARFYDAVMQVATRALDALPIRHAVVRYETLVTDLEAAVRPALALLALPWRDELAAFHRAGAGERINTPSYDQVRRPVHAGAIGRWRPFAPALAGLEPWLAPWIARFGYDPGCV